MVGFLNNFFNKKAAPGLDLAELKKEKESDLKMLAKERQNLEACKKEIMSIVRTQPPKAAAQKIKGMLLVLMKGGMRIKMCAEKELSKESTKIQTELESCPTNQSLKEALKIVQAVQREALLLCQGIADLLRQIDSVAPTIDEELNKLNPKIKSSETVSQQKQANTLNFSGR